MSKQNVAFCKAAILANGINLSFVEFPDNGYKYSSKAYNFSSPLLIRGAKRNINIIPQELIIDDNQEHTSTVSCIVDPSSKYSAVQDGSKMRLWDSINSLDCGVEIIIPKEPSFWKDKTSNDIPMVRILSTCGLCQANLWLWHECAYALNGKQCKFCGSAMQSKWKQNDLINLAEYLASNSSSFKQKWARDRDIVLDAVTETINHAIQKYYGEHIHLMLVSGNPPNNLLDDMWMMYVDALKDINSKICSLEDLDAVSILMPPNDFSWIEMVREVGLPKIAFNLEVWDSDIFSKIMPGKTTYGRERLLDALIFAVNIFGFGNVYTNLIIGIEPNESLLSGVMELADMGIVVNPMVFHQDYGAPMWKHPRPTERSILQISSEIARIYHRYGFRPLYCTNGARTSLINEAYLGWISIENYYLDT